MYKEIRYITAVQLLHPDLPAVVSFLNGFLRRLPHSDELCPYDGKGILAEDGGSGCGVGDELPTITAARGSRRILAQRRIS